MYYIYITSIVSIKYIPYSIVPVVGIFYTTAIVGPAIGYIVGGQLLKFYVDVGSVDTTKLVELFVICISDAVNPKLKKTNRN